MSVETARRGFMAFRPVPRGFRVRFLLFRPRRFAPDSRWGASMSIHSALVLNWQTLLRGAHERACSGVSETDLEAFSNDGHIRLAKHRIVVTRDGVYIQS
jgi:hypothetical protein